MQAAMSTGVSATYPAASACTKVTRSVTPNSAARSRAEAVKTLLRSTPVPVTPWSRAQRQSISPLPEARSSRVVPASSGITRPSRSSFGSSIGL